MSRILLLCLCLLLVRTQLLAAGGPETAKPEEKSPGKPAVQPAKHDQQPPAKAESGEPKEQLVETKHCAVINGVRVDYTAKAGTIVLRDNENKPTASIFYIAYTRDGIEDLSKRPITFSFNGGPGSSSVWMHLGLLGPRRVLLKPDGTPFPPPYQLIDNEYSLLDETDLVFIDPVSTGFSRAVTPEDAKKFHGVEGDIRSVADFIRLYTTRNMRWASPKFIIGESYGTTRAAGLSGDLRDRLHMNLNGIMFVSTVLNFETISFARGNELPYVLYLPTYTAAAWYHQKLAPDLEQLPLTNVLDQAKAFAANDYQNALLRGADLPSNQRRTIEDEFARFTGLPLKYVQQADLRVSIGRFAEELLRDQGRVIGRYDSRYEGYVRDRLASNMPYDPSGEAVYGVFTATFNQYVRTELKYESDLPYEILTGNVQPWNWGEQNAFLNVAETLADSLTRNPFLQVHVSSGYYDLATPFFATQYTFNHLGIDPALLKNIHMDYYTAGHMMYLNLADLKKQKADLARFIRSAAFQP
ncbi:MAG: peptidase S10 [Candidatus Omnitrophica bacterium]|nr:peptidase S10 [Candidatus Omnitrophota bacterium]